MKLLLISTQLMPLQPVAYGGLEVVVYDLSVELAKLGHKVYVLCPGGSVIPGAECLTPVNPHLSNPEAQAHKAIKPILHDFDVIHDHSWQAHVYLDKRNWPKLPVLHTLHGWEPYHENPAPKPCWVAPSVVHAQHTKQVLAPADCKVVYHGIDLERHAFESTKGDYLLYMARVSSFKGALEFVALCQKVGMKGLLAGEDVLTEDPYSYVRQVMQVCEATKGLVRYLGRTEQERKVELMQGARCLVTPLMPPYMEIFGLATVEALACGTPVLSTDRGAAQELIVHGVSGAIARDERCLVENLELALACKPEDCRAQAEQFGREKMAKDYLPLYEKVAVGEGW